MRIEDLESWKIIIKVFSKWYQPYMEHIFLIFALYRQKTDHSPKRINADIGRRQNRKISFYFIVFLVS